MLMLEVCSTLMQQIPLFVGYIPRKKWFSNNARPKNYLSLNILHNCLIVMWRLEGLLHIFRGARSFCPAIVRRYYDTRFDTKPLQQKSLSGTMFSPPSFPEIH